MKRSIVFYLTALVLLIIIFLFFGRAYRELIHYSELAHRHNRVYSSFLSLSKQLNNAAVSNPDFIKKASSTEAENLFYADSLSIIRELEFLKSTVKDSVNIRLVKKLEEDIKPELSWILNSNVPDSIIHHKSLSHIASFKNIDSNIRQGIERTKFLIKLRNEQLDEAVSSVRTWMILFILASGILLVYTTVNLFRQKSRTKLKESELEKSETRFRSLVENNEDIIAVLNEKFEPVYRSPSALQHTGWTEEERRRQTTIERTHPDDVEHVKSIMKQVLASPAKPFPITYRIQHKNGHYIWLEGRIINMLHEPGLGGIVANFRDITERKKSEERQAVFASIVNSSDDAIFSKNLDGIVTSWNHGAEKIFGYAAEEITGRHISILIPPHLQNEENEILKKIRNGESVDHYETERRRKDGEIIYVSITVSPIKDSSGNIIGASKISRDITERRKAAEKLLKANRLYAFISAINQSIVHIKDEQALLDNACNISIKIGQFKTAWISLLDTNGLLNMVSIKGDRNMVEEVQKHSGLDYSGPPLSMTTTGKVLSTGKYQVKNDLLNDPAMKPFKEIFTQHDIKSTVSFPITKFGKVNGTFGLHSTTEHYFDETEILLLEEAAGDISFALENFELEKLRKHTEAQLKQSETRFKKAQKIAHIGHWELDFATGVAEWSEESCRIYGLEPTDNKQSFETWASFVHPDDADVVMDLIKKQRQSLNSVSFVHRIVKKDGTIRYIHAESKFEFDPNGKPTGLYGITHDITEQKIAQEKLIKHITALSEIAFMQSHQARAPIANLLGLMGLFNFDNPEDPINKEVLIRLKTATVAFDKIIHVIVQKTNEIEKMNRDNPEYERSWAFWAGLIKEDI